MFHPIEIDFGGRTEPLTKDEKQQLLSNIDEALNDFTAFVLDPNRMHEIALETEEPKEQDETGAKL